MGDAQCGAAGNCGHRCCCRISARRRSSDRNSFQSKRDRPVCCAVDHDGRLCADTGLCAGRCGLHDDGVSDCRPPPVHDRSACLGEGLLSTRKVDDDRRRQHSSASVARHLAHRSVVGLWSRLSSFDRAVLVVFVLVLIIAAIGPFVAPYPSTFADPLQRLVSPNGAHPFGTDENGIDVLSRLIAAPRTDVLIAVIATTLSVAIGAPLGVVAGYFEGADRRTMRWISEGTLRLLDVIQAFPVFILAMVLVASRGATTGNIIIAVAFVNMPTFLRIARSEI